MSENVVEFEVLGQFYKGDKGDPGVVLTSQEIVYQVSSNGATPPSGEWSPTIPVVKQGFFLWSRTTLIFNSGDPVISYSVSRFGVDGIGSVTSVNDSSPDIFGNVTLDVGLKTINQKAPSNDGNLRLTAGDVGALPAEDAASKTFVNDRHKVFLATIAASWAGDSAPYTQSVSVPGILATDTPHVVPVFYADYATALAQMDAWASITSGTAQDNVILFTCLEDKPTVSIQIQIEVNR